jgi:hypothetical protein
MKVDEQAGHDRREAHQRVQDHDHDVSPRKTCERERRTER